MDPLRSNDNIAMGLQEESFETLQQNTIRKYHSAWNASYDQAHEATECCVNKWCRGNSGRQEGTLHHC